VEFEGGGHTDPVEVLRDAGRYTRLVARGWRIYRYTRFDVYGDPGRIITELTHALGRS
jgi:very-short-patch-repair endonuclease